MGAWFRGEAPALYRSVRQNLDKSLALDFGALLKAETHNSNIFEKIRNFHPVG